MGTNASDPSESTPARCTQLPVRGEERQRAGDTGADQLPQHGHREVAYDEPVRAFVSGRGGPATVGVPSPHFAPDTCLRHRSPARRSQQPCAPGNAGSAIASRRRAERSVPPAVNVLLSADGWPRARSPCPALSIAAQMLARFALRCCAPALLALLPLVILRFERVGSSHQAFGRSSSLRWAVSQKLGLTLTRGQPFKVVS